MRVLFWLILALLVLIDFQYIAADGGVGTIRYQGEAIAIVAFVLGVIFITIGIFNRVQDMLIAQGKLDRRVSTPYDIFPLLLLIPYFIGFQFFGDRLETVPRIAEGLEPYRWAFRWGLATEPAYAVPLMFLGMLALIFLYRVMTLLTKLRNHYQEIARNQGAEAGS